MGSASSLLVAIEGIECQCKVYIESYHAVPNLMALLPIADNLDSPLLYGLSAAIPVYVMLFAWLRVEFLSGLLEALQ
jgi:hypothetical protein